MAVVIDPRSVRRSADIPAVQWEDEKVNGAIFAAKMAGPVHRPQVELRRIDAQDTRAVIRLSAGGAVSRDGDTLDGGVVITTNKAIRLSWQEWYALGDAINQVADRLVEAQAQVNEQVLRKLAGQSE